MAGFLERARTRLRGLLGQTGVPAPVMHERAAAPDHPVAIGDHLELRGGAMTFRDNRRAAAGPGAWLDLFEAARDRNLPAGTSAIAAILAAATTTSTDAIWSSTDVARRVLEFLRPVPGLSNRLSQMRAAGLLGRLFPDQPAAASSPAADAAWAPIRAAIDSLERLPHEDTLSAERFGSMLGEISAPEWLTFALLVATGDPRVGRPADADHAAAERAFARAHLSADARDAVTLLLAHRAQMAQLAFRRDAGDPDAVGAFAAVFKTEEHLKLLCLLTAADPRLGGGQELTPWKAELLWRVFVDTYNHLTMAYADEVMDQSDAARATLQANRPADLPEPELTAFLDGMPRRYLTMFDADRIYDHARLSHNLGPDDVRVVVKPNGDGRELTVVTRDKPYFFANICGVLSSLGLDIERGHAITSLRSFVIDVFQLAHGPTTGGDLGVGALLADVMSGRVDLAERLREKERAQPPRIDDVAPPVIYFDNGYSHRYTVLEIVAEDSAGLLYRIGRAISDYGCGVELVLISTEAQKAVDVFHLKKDDEKLTDSDQLALTETLERALQA